MVSCLKYLISRAFCREAHVDFYGHKKSETMKTDRYESPAIEIIEMEVGQAVLSGSFTGEGINEWEDM